ncbi:MAG: nucleotidyltransferase [Nitrospirae bacterium]|nr:nucleotidyltransferase [Nitrospirota bacterium]
MEEQNARESRNPTLDDLIALCRSLNRHHVKYAVIGGFAVAHHGYLRATGDIDLLVDASNENIEKIRQALAYLPDKSVLEVKPGDVREYTVVRIADEVVIDLLHKACDMTYDQVKDDIDWTMLADVKIPFAGLRSLILTKQSIRPQDVQDRGFLEEMQRKQGI